MTVSLFPTSSLLKLTGCGRSNQVFFRCIFKTSRSKAACPHRETLLTWQQKSPEIKEKTEAILARLDRLTVESSTPGDGGESKRKMVLFESVFFGGLQVDGHADPMPEPLKNPRTSWCQFWRESVQLNTRKPIQTRMPWSNSQRALRTPSWNIRSVLISRSPSGCAVESASSLVSRERSTSRIVE